jgi:hypothetical protein
MAPKCMQFQIGHDCPHSDNPNRMLRGRERYRSAVIPGCLHGLKWIHILVTNNRLAHFFFRDVETIP